MSKTEYLPPIAALLIVLTTTQAFAGPISVSESGFDGTTTVSLSKHGTHCVNFSRCGYIGLQWSDKEPDMVIVQAGTFSESSIRRLLFSYGEVSNDYGEAPYTMDVFKEGATTYWGNRFVIPLADLKEAAAQDRWWMRLSGFNGSLDFPVIKDGKKSKVAKRLPDFLEKIEEVQE